MAIGWAVAGESDKACYGGHYAWSIHWDIWVHASWVLVKQDSWNRYAGESTHSGGVIKPVE